MDQLRVFWVLASKGGAGKTFFSMCLHRALYGVRTIDPRDVLILDLNTQNKDLLSILRKASRSDLETISIDVLGKNIELTLFKLREPNLYVASPNDPIGLASYVVLPIKLATILNNSTVIVDTNINLHSFHSLNIKSIRAAGEEISGVMQQYESIDPIFFFIWTTGSITRYIARSMHGELFEIERMFMSINRLSSIFGMQPEVFSMRNIVVTINSTLWIYNTITMLKIILKNLQDKILNSIIMRENTALYSFTRISRDVILKSSRIMAEILVGVSGRKPMFRYLEPMYMLTLYYILFGDYSTIRELLKKKLSIPEEINILFEKLGEEEPVDRIPLNLYVIPPPTDIHNIIPFIYSSHLLGVEDMENMLSDDDADGLPYSLVAGQARYVARYLENYLKWKEIA